MRFVGLALAEVSTPVYDSDRIAICDRLPPNGAAIQRAASARQRMCQKANDLAREAVRCYGVLDGDLVEV